MPSKSLPFIKSVLVIGVVLSVVSTTALALAGTQDPAAELFADDLPVSEEGLEIDLFKTLTDPYYVVDDRLTFEQEVYFRTLRSALRRSPTTMADPEDADAWSCWVSRGNGALSKEYVLCGGGGAFETSDQWIAGTYWEYRDYRVVSPALRRGELEGIFELLPGPESLDEEFVALAWSGGRTPRDFPEDDELARFANAYQVVSSLQTNGGSVRAQISAIESRGLTIERYNYIAELTEIYRSIESDIAARLE